jgi:HK97 family phage portal protein
VYYEYTEVPTDPASGVTQPVVREIRAGNMVHINGISWNGINGLNVIKFLADNFGLALANQQYLVKFFSEGATISGLLKHPGRLTPDAIKRLQASWQGTYAGSGNSGKVAIVEEGMDYQQVGLSPQQAGAADTKKLTISDIARIFGVPQFLLEDLDRATFSNIEHLSLLFRQHTIRPWCKRIESELNTKLFPVDEQVVFQVFFDIDDLAMSDLDSRSKWVESMMKWGILNRDEVRKKEGYNPIADGSGTAYYIPMNMADPTAPQPQPGQQLDAFNQNPQ